MGFLFVPVWLRGVWKKIHLIHSDQKAANVFSPLELMTAGAGICCHLHFRELREEKVGPTEGAGRTRGMV